MGRKKGLEIPKVKKETPVRYMAHVQKNSDGAHVSYSTTGRDLILCPSNEALNLPI